MSITVADCLKRPALNEAQLVAGANGLNRVVTSVSVIEYPGVPALTSEVVVGNELLLGALIQLKDNVPEQCRLLRHLHSMGVACLVVFYVGVFLPRIDPKLAQTADEINFPLIVMPYGRMDFRYCDVIADVMELVILEQKQAKYFVSDMVNRISQLSPQYCTISAVLRLLSDQLHCTLLLADRYFSQKGTAAWPLSNQWDYQRVLGTLRETRFQEGAALNVTLDKRRVMAWDIPVSAQNSRSFHLFVLDEQGNHDLEYVQQAAEVVEMFLNIWNKEVIYEQTDALVHAILADQPAEMNRIARWQNIDISSIHTMWVLYITAEDGQAVQGSLMMNCMRWCKQLAQEHHKLVFVDAYERFMVAFSNDRLFEETEMSIIQEFASRMAAEQLYVSGAVFENVENSSQARACYLLAADNLTAAHTVYPEKSIFTQGELNFVAECCEVIRQGEEAVESRTYCISPLLNRNDQEDLLKTLLVYLLDADNNTIQAGTLLFVHKNTIKYRIHKIKSLLNCDLAQMPEFFQFYQASALMRLIGK